MADFLGDVVLAIVTHPDVIIPTIALSWGYYSGSGKLARDLTADRISRLKAEIEAADERRIETEVQRRVRELTTTLEEAAKNYDRWTMSVAEGVSIVLASSDAEIALWRRKVERTMARRQSPIRLLAQLAEVSGRGVECPYKVKP